MTGAAWMMEIST
jgi:hypothetical protein